MKTGGGTPRSFPSGSSTQHKAAVCKQPLTKPATGVPSRAGGRRLGLSPRERGASASPSDGMTGLPRGPRARTPGPPLGISEVHCVHTRPGLAAWLQPRLGNRGLQGRGDGGRWVSASALPAGGPRAAGRRAGGPGTQCTSGFLPTLPLTPNLLWGEGVCECVCACLLVPWISLICHFGQGVAGRGSAVAGFK